MISAAILSSYLYTAMVTWCPLAVHNFTHAPQDVADTRYHAIADDLASVVLDPNESPIFSGNDGRVKTGMLMLAIASFESGQFSAKVDADTKGAVAGSGDNGIAHCLMQLHFPYASKILDRKSCFRAGLTALHDSFKSCNSMAAYASGTCADPRGLAKLYTKRATAYYKAHPFIFIE